jgi:excisionase family DNA binding protein
MTVAEVAAYLHISRTTLFGLLSSERFGPRKLRLGRCLRISRLELDRWIAAGAPPRNKWLERPGR